MRASYRGGAQTALDALQPAADSQRLAARKGMLKYLRLALAYPPRTPLDRFPMLLKRRYYGIDIATPKRTLEPLLHLANRRQALLHRLRHIRAAMHRHWRRRRESRAISRPQQLEEGRVERLLHHERNLATAVRQIRLCRCGERRTVARVQGRLERRVGEQLALGLGFTCDARATLGEQLA